MNRQPDREGNRSLAQRTYEEKQRERFVYLFIYHRLCRERAE